MLGRFLVPAALGVAALCSVAKARASEDAAATAEASDPIPRVELVLVGPVASGHALGEHLVSLFRNDVSEVRTAEVAAVDASTVLAPSTTVGVRIWVLVPASTTARLVFSVQRSAPSKPRFLVQDVELSGGLDEVGRERLAQVAYLSSLALWEGTVETAREEVAGRLAAWETNRPEPLPPARRAEWTPRARVGVGYTVRDRGDEGLGQGPAAALGVELLRGTTSLGATLHAALEVPRTAAKGGMTLDLVGGNLRLGASATSRVVERIWAVLEVGPGMDVVRFSTTFDDPAVSPSSARTDVRFFGYAFIGIRARLGPATIAAGPLLVVQLQRTHYDVTVGSERTEVLVPAIVQPGLAVSALW